MKDLREAASKAIEQYNRYRSPEATAKLVETGEQHLVVDFSGPFCLSCGVYDWFEDLIFESEALAQAGTRVDGFQRAGPETFRVRYTLGRPEKEMQKRSVDAFLRGHYEKVKPQVRERLSQFGEMLDRDDREIFAELCF